MNYSTALLVKRSAKQLNYFLKHTKEPKKDGIVLIDPFEPIASEDQIEGNRQAGSKAQSEFVEMLGVFKHRDISIYFSIDEIRPGKKWDYIVEHKWLKEGKSLEDWFFRQSLIQAAFLGSLASFVKDLKTAGFVKDRPHNIIELKDKFFTRLCFGDDTYDVKFEVLPIMRFFLTKARCVKSYKKAMQFDNTYRFHEWDKYFKHYIKYRKVK